MEGRIIICCVCVFFLNNINAQIITYNLPRDTSKFLGKVKSAYLFEYRITSFDTTKLNNNLTESLTPTYSYHFNEDKLMTKILSYQGGAVFSVTTFLYNQDNNLIFKIRDKPSVGFHIDEDKLGMGTESPNGDRVFNMTYTYFDDYNLIIKTDGAEVTRYHYNMDNLTLLVSSDIRKPSLKYLFDEKGRIIEIEDYTYEKGKLILRKERKRYDGDYLAEQERIIGNRAIVDYFTYDDRGRVITKKTVRTDSIYNRISHYQYIGDSIVEIKVYDSEGKLVSIISEASNKEKVTKKIKTYYEGGKVFPYSEIIEYKDDVGNVVKRYKIDAQKQSAIVAEYHFNYN